VSLIRKSVFGSGVLASALGAVLFSSVSGAQTSNVTLYGRVDLNYTKLSGDPLQMTQTSSSRWGLRGSESLGGGWNAIFTLESGINADTGSVSGNLFGRESWLGVSNRNFGTLRLGRSLVPSQRVASNYDPHGTDGIGSLGSGGLMITHAALTRFNNGIYYETPSMGGFTVFAAHQLDEVKTDTTDESVSSVRLRFQTGGFDASVAYGEVNSRDKVVSLGLAYDFKSIKPMMQFHDGKRNGDDRQHWLVGFTAPVGAGELRAAYSAQNDKSPKNADRKLFAIGYDYSLSKRTIVYGTLASDRRGLNTTAAVHKRGFELGMRHLF
jgi:predicted porin